MQNALTNISVLEEIQTRRQRKRFSLLTILFFVSVALLSVLIFPSVKAMTKTEAVALWTDGLLAQVAGTETWAGTGTQDDAYKLVTATDLAQLAVNVNAGNTYAGVHFELTKELNLAYKEWVPIGTKEHPFSGSFNGNNNRIYYMTISGKAYENVGLFGYVTESYLEKIAIVNAYLNVDAESTGSIAGTAESSDIYACSNDSMDSTKIGLLSADDLAVNSYGVSNLETWLSNAQMRGVMVSSSTVENITYSNKTSSSNSNVSSGTVGGIVGICNISGTISYCWNTSNINNSGRPLVGGILGQAMPSSSSSKKVVAINFCANAGNLYIGGDSSGAGGILAQMGKNNKYSYTSINSCYNIGPVDAADPDSSTKTGEGGILGYSYTFAGRTSIGDTGICYYRTGISATGNTGTGYSTINVAEISNGSGTSSAAYQMNGYTYNSSTGAVSALSYASHKATEWSTSNWNQIAPTTKKNDAGTHWVTTMVAVSPKGPNAWSANSYNSVQFSREITSNLTFDKQGGTGGTASITAKGGLDMPAITVPTKTGYAFQGYYKSTNGSGTKYYNADGTSARKSDLEGSVTLYAYWTANSYTISFNANGGSGSMSDLAMTYGTAKALTANSFTRTYYNFLGWSTDANATTATYSDKQSVSNLTTTHNGNVVLYAVWQKIKYTATLSAPDAKNSSEWTNKGSWTTGATKTATKAVTYDEALGTLPTPQRDGYTFTGWYTPGGSKIDSTTTIQTNSTFNARWSANTYKVTLNSAGAQVAGTAEVTATYNSAMPGITLPTKYHYVFAGYFDGQNGAGTQYYSSNGGSSRVYNKTSGTTLYAHWTPASITVSFNSNGGTACSNISVAMGSTFGTLPVSTKAGYILKSWHYDSSLSDASKVTSSSTLVDAMIPGNANTMTLYAKWELIKFNLTLQANDASANASSWSNISGWTASNKTASRQFTYGDSLPTMPTPSRDGYTFKGWYTASSGGTAYTQGSKLSFETATTLYAQWNAITYTLTINPAGGSIGSASATQKGTIGTAVTLPTATKTGYDFSSWQVTSGAGGLSGSKFTFSASDATVTAVWTPKTFNLNFDKNDASATWSDTTGCTANGSLYKKQVKYDEKVGTLPQTQKSGYNFSGWFDQKSGGTQYNADTIWKRTSDLTLYAQYTINNFTLTIDKRNGEPLLSRNDEPGSEYTLPTPVRNGYVFNGWEMVYGVGTLSGGLFTYGQGNATIGAKWTAISYIVTYNSNGGSGTMANSTFTYDVQASLRLNAFTRTGYKFKGWNLKADGSDTSYSDGYLVLNWTATANATFTLYAQWEVTTYTVIYDASGGVIQSTTGFGGSVGKNTSSLVFNYGANIGTLPNVALKGYEFKEWRYGNGAKVNTTDKVTQNLTIYAYLVAKTYKLTVSLDSLGGTLTQVSGWSYSSGSASKSITYGEMIGVLPQPQLNGYVFLGWFVSATSTEQYVSTSIFSFENDLNLVPHYSTLNYTLFFDANGGICTIVSKVLEYNSAFGTLPTPQKLGYEFNGWFYQNNQSKQATASDKIVANTNLFAKWSAKQFIVTFDVATNGGSLASGSPTMGYYYDSVYSDFPTVTKEGATFVGWFDDKNGMGQQYIIGATVSITSNITLYAVFDVNKHTVLFNSRGGFCGTTSMIYEYNDQLGMLPKATKVGYAFLGWSKIEDGKNSLVSVTDLVKNDFTLYAQYSPISYTIKFNKNRSDATGLMDDQVVNYDETFALRDNAFASPSAKFLGWCADPNGNDVFYVDKQRLSNLTTVDAETITFYAQWSVTQIVVTVIISGGSFDNLNGYTQSGMVATKTFSYGQSLGALPDVSRYGYNVTGFRLAGTTTAVDSNYVVTTSLQIEPVYVAKNVEITISAGDGVFTSAGDYTLSADNKSATATRQFEGGYGTLPTATKTGYTLSAYKIKDTQSVANEYAVIYMEGPIELQADFVANTFLLKLNADGGTIANLGDSVYDIDATFDAEIGELPQAERVGHTFKGWFTGKNGVGDEIKSTTIYKWNENITAYAYWTTGQIILTIDPNGGVYDGSTTPVRVEGYYDKLETLKTPTRTGYNFAGFVKVSTGQDEGSISGDLSSGFSFRFGLNDASIKAQWTPKNITILFNYNGATGNNTLTSLQVVYDSTYSGLPTPTKTNYEFAGWFRESNFQNAVYASDKVKDTLDTITLYAKWTNNEYTLKIDANGGSYSGVTTVAGGAGATVLLSEPTRVGYEFTRWIALSTPYYGSVANSASSWVFTFGNGNGCVQAEWTPIKYTISFSGNGGVGAMSNMTDLEYDRTYNLTENKFTKVGHKFIGWLWNGRTFKDEASISNLVTTTLTLTFVAQWGVETTTLTINPNGGEYQGSPSNYVVSKTFGEQISVAIPTKYGYNFTGYQQSVQNALSGNAQSGYTYTFLEVDVLLTAQWEVKKFIVTFDPGDGQWVNVGGFTQEGGKIKVEVTYGQEYGAIPTASNLSCPGFEFVGWFTTDDKQIVANSIVTYDQAITLTARFSTKQLVLTVNPNGGVFNSTESTSIFYGVKDDIITLSNPSRLGYTFGGWSKDGDGEIADETFTFKTENTVLTARWIAITYTVKFNANGGEGSMDELELTYDASEFLTTNAFTKAGYSFVCWNTKENGTGQSFANQANVVNLAIAQDFVFMLYAQWEVGVIVVNFDANQGVVSSSIKNIFYGDTYESFPTATREGYDFVGWFTEKVGGTKKITSDIVTENHTLYAQWSAKTYEITFNAVNGLIVDKTGWTGVVGGVTTTKQVTYGQDYGILPEAKHTTKAFVGWFTSTQQGVQVLETMPVTFAGDQTLYAHYTESKVSISFNANGGSLEYNIITLNYGDPYQLPNAERVGYEFAGWYLGDQLITEKSLIEEPENHMLDAQWTPLQFTLTLDFDGGSYVETQGFGGQVQGTSATMTITYGMSYGTLPEVKKEGFKFVGFYNSSNERIYDSLLVSVLSDFIATAKYETIAFDLTINPNGGTYDGLSTTTTISNIYGTQIELLKPERYGYEFVRFSNSTEFGFIEGSLKDGFKFTYGAGNTVIVAEWKAKIIQVKYSAMEGYVSGVDFVIDASKKNAYKNYNFGQVIGLMPTAELIGYRFIGWFTEENGGMQLTESKEITNAENFILYAHYEKYSYNLIVNPKGGTFRNTTDTTILVGEYGQTIDIEVPTREGYDFKGFVFSGSGDAVKKNEDTYSFTYGAGNATLSAQWEAQQFVVTFDYQGADAGNSTATKQVIFGALYGSLPEPTKTGYQFKGWYTKAENGERVDSLQTVTRSENHTLYAQWELQKYNLRVILDGGSIDGSESKFVDYQDFYGEVVQFSVPTKYGYDFNDFTKQGTTGSYEFSGNKVLFTFGQGDVTLVAKWIAKTAKVTLDAGEGEIQGQRFAYIDVTFGRIYGDLPTPSKFGYDFVGWFNDEGKEIIASNPIIVEGDHTLVARYEQQASALILILNGGELQTSDGKLQWEKKYGEKVSFGVPTRQGYEFVDFEVATNGQNTLQVEGEDNDRVYTFTFNGFDTILSAKWRAETYKVTFNAGEGVIMLNSQETGNTKELSIEFGERYDKHFDYFPTAYLYGYSFEGWFTENDEQIIGSSIVKISQAHTLTAKYNQLTYVLTVDLNGGELNGDKMLKITQIAGSTYTFANNPTKTGYDFVDFTLTSAKGEIEVVSGKWIFTFEDENSSIVANYTAKTFTLALDPNSGTIAESVENKWEVGVDGVATKQVTYNEKYGELPIPTKASAHFLGWYTAKEGGTPVTEFTTVEILSNQRVYARWAEKDYILTIEMNGGVYKDKTSNFTELGQENATYIFDAKPTKIGHTFVGFELFCDIEGEGQLVEDSLGNYVFTFGAGNAVISFNFQPNTIVVTLQAGSGTFENLENWQTNIDSKKEFNGWVYDETRNVVTKDYVYGEKIGQMPIVTLKGNVFSGWYKEDIQFIANSSIEVLDATLTLQAKFNLSKFTLVINPNGGEYEGVTSIVNISGNYGSTYTIQKPTRTGYKFVEWTEIAGTEGEGIIVGDMFTYGADTFTIIANWEPITYKISFTQGANDVEGEMQQQELTYDIASVINNNNFTREGYYFVKWVDDNLNEYVNKQLVLNLSSTQGAVITLTAIWDTNIYNIYYDANNGTVEPIAVKVKYLDKFGEMPTPTRIGYTFVGWFESIVNGQPQGQQITSETINNKSGDRTLYAHWVINTYTITLPDVPVDAGQIVIEAGYSTVVVFNDDFAFKIKKSEAFNKSQITAYANGEKIMMIDDTYFISKVQEDLTITLSGLVKNTYTITFNSMGGSNVPQKSVEWGEKVSQPTPPTLVHYDFTKWYEDIELTQEFDFANTLIYENKTLYAGYQKATYEVKFYLTVGAKEQYGETQNVIYQERASRPANPYVYGYDFIGWYEQGSTTAFDFRSQITGHLQLYGKFSANTYVVTFYNGIKILGQRSVEHGNAVLPYENTQIEGFNFIGWYVDSELLIPYDFETMVITQNTNIFAKYEVIQYEVKFYVDGILQATRKFDYKTLVVAPSNVKVPVGHHIESWFLDEALTQEYDFSRQIDGDFELYGKYVKDNVIITFNINNQIELRPIPFGNALSTITLPTLTNIVGYTKVSPYYKWTDENGMVWKIVLDEELGEYVFVNEFEQKVALSEFYVTEPIEIVAVYTVNIYTITFMMPDGTKVERYVEHGGSVEDLPKIELSFGDKLSYNQTLTYIQGDMTVQVKIVNYLRIPLLIVIILVGIGLVTIIVIVTIKLIKKRGDRGKIKDLIGKRW